MHCISTIIAEGSVEGISKESLGVLYFVLPGLVAAWVFYGLTAHPKKETFERVVQALIFTIFIKAMNLLVRKAWWVRWHSSHPTSEWTEVKELYWSLANAFLLGLLVAVCANWDLVHRVLRISKITKRTSHPSEWYSGFHRLRREVVLHLDGERRLKGWADEWPDQCEKGHFIIESPIWLDVNGEELKQSRIERLMVPASEVEMVEFWYDEDEMRKSPEKLQAAEKERLALAQLHKESADGKEAPEQPGPDAEVTAADPAPHSSAAAPDEG